MTIEWKNEERTITCSEQEYHIIQAALYFCAEREKELRNYGVLVDPVCSSLLEKFHKAVRPED